MMRGRLLTGLPKLEGLVLYNPLPTVCALLLDCALVAHGLEWGVPVPSRRRNGHS